MDWSGSVFEPVPAQPPKMRWWGWGEDDHAGGLPPQAQAFLDEHLGTAAAPRPPVDLEQVRIEPSSLPQDARAELAGILGGGQVRDDRYERVLHAAGKGYPDLVRMRAGTPEGAPEDRKSTRLNSSHANISYAVFCLKKKTRPTAHGVFWKAVREPRSKRLLRLPRPA